jgi:hypothetical protein
MKQRDVRSPISSVPEIRARGSRRSHFGVDERKLEKLLV